MRIVGWDLETDRLSAYHPEARCLTVAFAEEVDGEVRTWGYVLDHPLDTETTDEELQQRVNEANKILTDPDVLIVGHSITSFDLHWWGFWAQTPVKAQWFDSRIAYALLDENSPNTLAHLAATFTPFRADVEKKGQRKKLATLPPADVLEYNKSDAAISLATYAPLISAIREQGLEELLKLKHDVARVLVDMALTGVEIDPAFLGAQDAAIAGELAHVHDELRQLVKGEINWNSPQQVAHLLYDVYRMPVVAKSKKTGKPSTSKEALMELRARAKTSVAQHFLDLLLDRARLSKLRGTYLKTLGSKHLGADGRVHTTYNLARGSAGGKIGGAVTGRLSSMEPNLQNLPRDKRVKGVVVPGRGLRLVNADYSQLEIRIAAAYSQEPVMLQAIRLGQDIHTAMLADLEGVTYEVAKDRIERLAEWVEKRALIKRINFGILYGVGPFRLVKLAREMGIFITRREAEALIERYKKKYATLTEWIEDTQRRIVRDGWVATPTGTRRRLPAVDPATPDGQRALRQGVNFMVQSWASDFTLHALIRMNQFFAREGGARLLLTVHDSVLSEYVPEDWSDEELEATMRRLMINEATEEMQIRFGEIPEVLLAVDVETNMERWS